MLFVRRRIHALSEDSYLGYIKYTVYDTDDGDEAFVDAEVIARALNRDGLTIMGAKDDGRMFTLYPYQLPSQKSAMQTKLETLRHISVKAHNGMITDINWNRMNLVRDNTAVRLSDFGTSCADFLMFDSVSVGTKRVRLVFDDKLKEISNFSFRMEPDVTPSRFVSGSGWPVLGVSFDLRELTNDDIAVELYKQILCYRCDENTVLDNPKRYEACLKLYGGINVTH